MSFLYSKYIHPISTSLKILSHSSINSESQISSKYDQLKKSQISPSKSSKSGIGETLGMIHTGAKFFFIYGLAKLRKQVICFQDTMVGQAKIDIPIPKERNWKEKRSHGSQASQKPRKHIPLDFKAFQQPSVVGHSFLPMTATHSGPILLAHWVSSSNLSAQGLPVGPVLCMHVSALRVILPPFYPISVPCNPGRQVFVFFLK